MRPAGLLLLVILSQAALTGTRQAESVRDILGHIKTILEKQNVVVLDIQDKLNKSCLQSTQLGDVESQVENNVLKKLLAVISDKKESEQKEISAEKIEVERRAKLLLPRLETHLNTTTEKIAEIQSQLNLTRMVKEGLWEEAKKEVRATQDIFNKLNASTEYFKKSKLLGKIWEDGTSRFLSLMTNLTRMSKATLACVPGYESLSTAGCYRLHLEEKYSFEEAFFACQVEESDLLEIRSKWEYSRVMDRVKGFNIWLGIKRDFMGFWRWISSNQETTFTDWYRKPRRDDGGCAYIDNTGQAGWFNYHCTASINYKTGFVCKRNGTKLETLFNL